MPPARQLTADAAQRTAALVLALVLVVGLPPAIATAQPALTMRDLPSWAQRDPARYPTRRALVVGVGDYAHAPDLTTPRHDARLISTLLAANQFIVRPSLSASATRKQILDEIDALAAEVREGDIVVVYFSGHGLSDGVSNYLVPAEATLAGTNREPFVYVPLDYVFAQLRPRNPASIAVILDACRINPFAARPSTVSEADFEPVWADGPAHGAQVPGGLREVPIRTRDSSVGFSAGIFQIAYSLVRGDQADKGSIFTRMLEQHLRLGETFDDAFGATSREVGDLTREAQLPLFMDAGAPDFAVVRTPWNDGLQEHAWLGAHERARANGDELGAMRNYLRHNAASDFAPLARARVRQLQGPRLLGASQAGLAAYASLWEGNLASPLVDAGRTPDIALTTRQVALVEPRSVFNIDPLFPDRTISMLPEGQEVRVIDFIEVRRLARVELPNGVTGYLRNVDRTAPQLAAIAELVYQGDGAEAHINDWGPLDRLGSLLHAPNAEIRILVGRGRATGIGRSEQLAYMRALDLASAVTTRGAAAERVRIEVAAEGLATDTARIEVSVP